MSSSTDHERDLSYATKEVLSWMTIAYMLRELADPVRVMVTHPGGGMYDCLTLLSEGGQPLVSLNREGSSALVGDEVISDIWTRAGLVPGGGPMEAAYFLLSESDLGVEIDQPLTGTARAAITLANLLNLHRDHDVHAVPVWHGWGVYRDLEEDLGLLEPFTDLDEWLAQPPPIPGMTASGWLVAFVYDGTPRALVNMRTGEVRYAKPYLHPPLHEYVDHTGQLACPIALSISCVGFDGKPILTDSIEPMHSAHRLARNLSGEMGIVSQTPIFTIPTGWDWEPPQLQPGNYLD